MNENNMNSMTLVQQIGALVASARAKTDLSASELSIKCGMSFNYVTLVENGKLTSPGVLPLIQIAQILNVPIEDLIPESYRVLKKPPPPEPIRAIPEKKSKKDTVHS